MNHNHHRTFITQNSEIIDIIRENGNMLLMLEHFEIDFSVGNKTVLELCKENDVHLDSFLAIANLYHGYFPDRRTILPKESLNTVIKFLKNSHVFYTRNKHKELTDYINKLKENESCNSKNIYILESFFNEYFNEVKEHLRYEDEVAFPFFLKLINNGNSNNKNDFSVKTYSEHHSDIETKLEDLRNLLLNDINISNDTMTKRKFYNGLVDLETDLKLHSVIEEILLIPSIEHLESKKNA